MKLYKPKTPGTRGMSVPSYKKSLTVSEPVKQLTHGFKRMMGRNSQGRITSRHRGGGHKRLYREIDFVYNKKDIPAKVHTIEYDPNRTAFIASVAYADGEKRYILAPQHMKVGDTIITADKAPLEPGNRMRLRNIPVGAVVHNVELKVDGGAKLGRSAGGEIEVIAHDTKRAHLKLSSSEIRMVPVDAYASIGKPSNEEHHLRTIGKAGRSRHMGRRPRVRGAAMNAVDHPYGGGEGRAGRGRRRAVTIFGKPAGKRQRTRKPKRYSDTLIVRRRKIGKRR